jgi:hypothetical protein
MEQVLRINASTIVSIGLGQRQGKGLRGISCGACLPSSSVPSPVKILVASNKPANLWSKQSVCSTLLQDDCRLNEWAWVEGSVWHGTGTLWRMGCIDSNCSGE